MDNSKLSERYENPKKTTLAKKIETTMRAHWAHALSLSLEHARTCSLLCVAVYIFLARVEVKKKCNVYIKRCEYSVFHGVFFLAKRRLKKLKNLKKTALIHYICNAYAFISSFRQEYMAQQDRWSLWSPAGLL